LQGSGKKARCQEAQKCQPAEGTPEDISILPPNAFKNKNKKCKSHLKTLFYSNTKSLNKFKKNQPVGKRSGRACAENRALRQVTNYYT
jgi:hypothetical protein